MSDSPPTRPKSDWKSDLKVVDKLMRAVSRETDPQRLVMLYGNAVDRMFPIDLYVALSRRGLEPPMYRMTRNSNWREDINPWTQRDRLPLLSGGILGEWAYADAPVIIQDFQPDDVDQHYELLKNIRSVLVFPQYDNGEAINISIMMWERPGAIDVERLPHMHWQGNLFGRATHNLVLRRELATAYETLDRELQVVGDIQRSLLPAELPRIPTLELAAHYRTSQRAGGDYYDLFPLTDDRWGLFIADVSGHGTPAAVMMAVTHAIAHSHPKSPEPPEAVLARLNNTLHDGYTRGNGTFVTAFYAVFDAKKRTLRYSSAGHNPPRLRRDGEVLALDAAQSLPLGVLPDVPFAAAEMALRPGDGLLLYTDGIIEAMNRRNELFGVDRLDESILEASTSDGMIAAVTSAVERHAGSGPPTDDQTLLAGLVK
jgi:sigma-B regulation protein RsbU (phosphoserine phosphatase)